METTSWPTLYQCFKRFTLYLLSFFVFNDFLSCIFHTICAYLPLVVGRQRDGKEPLNPKPLDFLKVSWLEIQKATVRNNHYGKGPVVDTGRYKKIEGGAITWSSNTVLNPCIVMIFFSIQYTVKPWTLLITKHIMPKISFKMSNSQFL